MSEGESIPFTVSGNGAPQMPSSDNQIVEQDIPTDLTERLQKLVTTCKIVLFMKGNAKAPQCGFSANTVGMLQHLGVEFQTFDIFSDEDVRQGLKEFSNWPTFPQLYVDGKMVGGNDIVTEMYESGELQELLK